ncbi:MAG: TRAP transporter large permease [Armatimonadetes bacterium]|nr:TRAP transporter large permease [Armatimonadota bacterium]
MGWEANFIIIFGSLFGLILLGIPVAFAFMLVVMVGYIIFVGGWTGINQFIFGIFSSVANFNLSPVPFFILMGELLFRSGLALVCINGISKWLSSIPARLSILTVISGAFFGALSGSTMANTAMLGTLLLPEMEKNRYNKYLSVGPIMAAGGLAMIIPPSALAVIYAAIAQVSVSGVLVAGIVPGILMALGYIVVILIRVWLDPQSAPSHKMEGVTWSERFRALFLDVAPLSLICLLMYIFITFGIGTPTEAAAVGAVGALILVILYRRFSWQVFFQSVMNTIITTAMIFFITCSSTGFSQLAAYTGVTAGLLAFVTQLNLDPLLLIVAMLAVVIILGCFMDQIAIMMIVIPVFVPIVNKLGFDPIWFAVLMLICIHEGLITPPFGLELFVMKSISPETKTKDLYLSVYPIIISDLVVTALIIVFPSIALWLVSIGRWG